MTVTVKRDDVQKIMRSVHELVSRRVMVGVPSKTAKRKDGGPMNNAAILYCMETGMPEHNVPARPSLIPGVEKALPACTKVLQRAARQAMDGQMAQALGSMSEAGQRAASSVKAVMGSNIPPPLAESTIANRYRQRMGTRGVKSRRPEEQAYLDMRRKGLGAAAAQSSAGIVALVNTGDLRNAITSEVRKAK